MCTNQMWRRRSPTETGGAVEIAEIPLSMRLVVVPLYVGQRHHGEMTASRVAMHVGLDAVNGANSRRRQHFVGWTGGGDLAVAEQH